MQGLRRSMAFGPHVSGVGLITPVKGGCSASCFEFTFGPCSGCVSKRKLDCPYAVMLRDARYHSKVVRELGA